MEKFPDYPLLKLNLDLVVRIRKINGFDNAEDMNRAIDTLEDWLKKQDHFTKKDFSRDYLERGIIFSKGSIELAKSRLDKLCTMRTLMPHFFQNYDFEKNFKFPKIIHVLLPKLAKDNTRVIWCRFGGEQFTSSLLLNLARLGVVIAEYYRSRDYVNNVIIVQDLRAMNLANALMNIDVNNIHQLITILLNGYGLSFKGLHYLTSSKLIESIVTMIKPMLSSKINQRVKVHKDVESIYEFVPKEILPVDYGGEEKPLQEHYDDWVDELSSKEFKAHWMEMCRAGTDESRRQTDKFNEQYMGMPGSFRTLSVD